MDKWSTSSELDEQMPIIVWLLTTGEVQPVALKAAIDLGILERVAKVSEGEGLTQLTSEEREAQLRAKSPDAPVMLERLLC